MPKTLELFSGLDESCKEYCRKLLLDKLTQEQRDELLEIENSRKLSFRHGARGSYVDPVASHKKRIRTNKNFFKAKRKKK